MRPSSLMIGLTTLLLIINFFASAEEKIKTKHAYEHVMKKCVKEVRHHHVDNNTCAIESFKRQINDSKQALAFCSVGSHQQN